MMKRIAIAMTVFSSLPSACCGAPPLMAGAHAVDITPPFDSLIINGGFTEQTRGRMQPGDLHARCLVLDDGTTRIAMAVVDSCMLPRDVCERAKVLAFEATGIEPGHIMISATHTHSAPSAMNYCLGTRADPNYPDFLPPKIAECIAQADRARQPARIGWARVSAPEFTHCRRWITRPDKMQNDPFGHRTVRAMMHPGYQNPAYIGPAGPVDDELSVLSVQSADGAPIAVLANYSMHYYGGCGPADYFGLFARGLSHRLARKGVEPVCMMTQGTSGDLHWMDYSQPKRGTDANLYTERLAALAEQALTGIVYRDAAPLGVDQRTPTLARRLPDESRLSWARGHLEKMQGRRPATRPEVYAEQAVFIHENPTERLVLQAIRIGDLGITAIPNEVYGITGLKLKAQSPFESTFNIELANGAAGYIPPPAQHRLGGYTTWPARTAGLEEQAEPKIVESLLASLERLAGKPRRPATPPDGTYARAILADDPEAYWRMEELEGNSAADRSGHGRQGSFEGLIAHGLPGACDRVVQLVGGAMTAVLPPPGKGYTCSLWFWNGMPAGTLFSCGPDALALDQHGHLTFSSMGTTVSGASGLGLKAWHHVTVSRGRDKVRIFLDGAGNPELSGPVQAHNATDFRLGPCEGRIDEAAVFGRVLSGEDAARHYAASGRTPPPRPPLPPPQVDKSSDAAKQTPPPPRSPAGESQDRARARGIPVSPNGARLSECSGTASRAESGLWVEFNGSDAEGEALSFTHKYGWTH